MFVTVLPPAGPERQNQSTENEEIRKTRGPKISRRMKLVKKEKSLKTTKKVFLLASGAQYTTAGGNTQHRINLCY